MGIDYCGNIDSKIYNPIFGEVIFDEEGFDKCATSLR